MGVSPFRHLRITGYVLLPAAFRSLSRLSSALSAKASTLRSYWLDLAAFRSLSRLSSALSAKASTLRSYWLDLLPDFGRSCSLRPPHA